MILPNQKDALHKSKLYDLLRAIADNSFLISVLRFKGGTCASMLGFLDRFSVDLDFDLIDEKKLSEVRKELEKIFEQLELTIKDQSKKVPQYFLKYETKELSRNTLRLDVSTTPAKENDYEAFTLREIDRVIHCQTVETMFANKLVAVINRFELLKNFAGRDIFDLYSFFANGYSYKSAVIEERRGIKVLKYLKELKKFIEEKVSQKGIDEDITMLLPSEKFHKIRKNLKSNVLLFLNEEIKRLEATDSK